MTQTLPTPRGTLTPNRPLADLTWLRVGGPADWLFQPADEADLAEFLGQLDLQEPNLHTFYLDRMGKHLRNP